MLSTGRLIVGGCVAQVMYDRACKFWHFLYSIFQEYRLMSGRQWMMFYATEMRFFRQMLMAAKVLLGPINSFTNLIEFYFTLLLPAKRTLVLQGPGQTFSRMVSDDF